MKIPINAERNSLQFEARMYGIEAEVFEKEVSVRVFALRGYLSKYAEELELSPGWHRLPNGVIVYSDPVAIRLADARQSVDGEWKS